MSPFGYYLDHRDEMDEELAWNTPAALAEHYDFTVEAQGKLVFQRNT